MYQIKTILLKLLYRFIVSIMYSNLNKRYWLPTYFPKYFFPNKTNTI